VTEPERTDADRLDTLARVGGELTAAVDALRKRTRRSEIWIVLTVVGFCLDIALTITITVGLVNQTAATTQIQQVQNNASVVRQKVLCPLYDLLIGAYSTQARAVYPHGPAAYDAAFATLRKAASALDCSK